MALTRLTIRQLEAFDAVAETLSFVAAGGRLSLTSSAVSQLVAELEALVGFRVFDRSTRRVSLSSAGRDFLGPAQTVLRDMRLAEVSAADVRNRAAGIVRIGAPLVLASAVLPAAIREFTRERPKVAIYIRDTPVDQLVDRVATGDLELALGPDRPDNPTVQRSSIFGSPWVLWCNAQHPLAARRGLTWQDLRDVSLVAAGRDHEVSVAQMRANAPNDHVIKPVEVVDNVTTALGIAAQGNAVTLAPAYVEVIAANLGLVMRRVKKPETIRYVSLYQPMHRSIPPAAQAFAEFLAPWVRQWNVRQSAARRQFKRPG